MKLLKGKESKLTLLIFLLSFFLVGSLIAGNISDGYTIFKNGGSNDDPVFWNTSNDTSNISVTQIGTCIENNTDKDYFVPTRTKKEWDSFVSVVANPLNPLGLKLVGCAGDKECRMSAGENCANAETDCGGCGIPCSGTITYDGVIYGLVQINNQCWLNKNLDVGTRIDFPAPESGGQTNNGTIEKYCVNNDSYYGCLSSGGLYSYQEAMAYSPASTTGFTRGICPEGWHIPSISDFETLTNYLGGNTIAGRALKKSGIGSVVYDGNGPIAYNWIAPNTGATNSSGFSAVPSRVVNHSYISNPGEKAGFRTTDTVLYFELSNNSSGFYTDYIDPSEGLSVRCIRDIEPQKFYVIFKSVFGGYISGNPYQILYGTGKSASTVTATPNTGCIFVNWSDGSTLASRTITNVTNHVTLTANFNCAQYTLQYNTTGSGAIIGSTTQVVFSGMSGSEVIAKPTTGYRFASWTDGLTINPRIDSNVTTNKNVAASFATLTIPSGCGVCGLTSSGATCPNTCFDGNANMTNCAKDLDCTRPVGCHPCGQGDTCCNDWPAACSDSYYLGNPSGWHCE